MTKTTPITPATTKIVWQWLVERTSWTKKLDNFSYLRVITHILFIFHWSVQFGFIVDSVKFTMHLSVSHLRQLRKNSWNVSFSWHLCVCVCVPLYLSVSFWLSSIYLNHVKYTQRRQYVMRSHWVLCCCRLLVLLLLLLLIVVNIVICTFNAESNTMF